MADLTVHINKTIHAPIEQVFDAWLNPEMLSKFMMPMQGMRESEIVNDAREGGEVTIIMHAGDNKLPHTGKYVVIDRPYKLVFTWVSDHSIDSSMVTLEFTTVNGTETNVSLLHVKFIDEQARSDHEGGWRNILDKLNNVME